MEHDKVTDKTITRYRKFFGVGPLVGSIGLCMLSIGSISGLRVMRPSETVK